MCDFQCVSLILSLVSYAVIITALYILNGLFYRLRFSRGPHTECHLHTQRKRCKTCLVHRSFLKQPDFNRIRDRVHSRIYKLNVSLVAARLIPFGCHYSTGLVQSKRNETFVVFSSLYLVHFPALGLHAR